MSNPVQQIYEFIQAELDRSNAGWRPASELRFRPSEVGGCAREVYYRLQGNKPKPIAPVTQLLFDEGNQHHDSLRNLMQKAGIEMADLIFKDGKVEETGSARRVINVEFGGKEYPVLISGRTDGSVALDGTMVLLEIKSINKNKYDNFQRIFLKGGEKALLDILQDKKTKESGRQGQHANRRFWYQFQTTLLVADQPTMYVVFKNRDNGQLGFADADGVRHGLRIEANTEVQGTILRRCAQIMRALEKKTPPLAEFMDGSMSCNMCNFYHLCWGANKEKSNETAAS